MPRLILVVVVVLLCAIATVMPPYTLTLITEALIFGLFAMSLDLMVGYTRLYSFGHTRRSRRLGRRCSTNRLDLHQVDRRVVCDAHPGVRPARLRHAVPF